MAFGCFGFLQIIVGIVLSALFLSYYAYHLRQCGYVWEDQFGHEAGVGDCRYTPYFTLRYYSDNHGPYLSFYVAAWSIMLVGFLLILAGHLAKNVRQQFTAFLALIPILLILFNQLWAFGAAAYCAHGDQCRRSNPLTPTVSADDDTAYHYMMDYFAVEQVIFFVGFLTVIALPTIGWMGQEGSVSPVPKDSVQAFCGLLIAVMMAVHYGEYYQQCNDISRKVKHSDDEFEPTTCVYGGVLLPVAFYFGNSSTFPRVLAFVAFYFVLAFCEAISFMVAIVNGPSLLFKIPRLMLYMFIFLGLTICDFWTVWGVRVWFRDEDLDNARSEPYQSAAELKQVIFWVVGLYTYVILPLFSLDLLSGKKKRKKHAKKAKKGKSGGDPLRRGFLDEGLEDWRQVSSSREGVRRPSESSTRERHSIAIEDPMPDFFERPVQEWTPSTVGAFVATLGEAYAGYGHVIDANGLEGGMFLDGFLDEAQLIDLGILKFHAKVIMRKLQERTIAGIAPGGALQPGSEVKQPGSERAPQAGIEAKAGETRVQWNNKPPAYDSAYAMGGAGSIQ